MIAKNEKHGASRHSILCLYHHITKSVIEHHLKDQYIQVITMKGKHQQKDVFNAVVGLARWIHRITEILLEFVKVQFTETDPYFL